MQIPHVALTDIRTVEDAASYWEGRLAAVAEAKQREDQHWTRVHPSNVQVLIGDSRGATEEALREWLEVNGQEFDRSAARDRDPPF